MDDKLIRRCIALPKEEKLILIKHMQCTMMDEREDDGSRFHKLFKAATKVVGGGKVSDSKLRNAVIGRKLITYQMVKEGYNFRNIGKYMKRDRTSIRFLYRYMDDAMAYPKMFPDEMKAWEEFQKLIGDKDNEDDKEVL